MRRLPSHGRGARDSEESRDLRDAGWDFERVSTDNGSEFRNHRFDADLDKLGVLHTLIRPGRPQSNGFVERVQRTILEECWKPAFARYPVPKYMGLRRELERYLWEYNFDRAHNGRLTKGRTPAEVLGAAKMWRQQTGCVGTSWGQHTLVGTPAADPGEELAQGSRVPAIVE
jgi:transposase InsO family protein